MYLRYGNHNRDDIDLFTIYHFRRLSRIEFVIEIGNSYHRVLAAIFGEKNSKKILNKIYRTHHVLKKIEHSQSV